MASDEDSFRAMARTARERDLKPLLEESAVALELDGEQVATMEAHLDHAWLLGVKIEHKTIADSKGGKRDPKATLLNMQDELQDSMQMLADALNTTVRKTVMAWNYLERAWTAGAKFWEMEIAARLIESQTADFDDPLGRPTEEGE